jgi:hypothetical protein
LPARGVGACAGGPLARRARMGHRRLGSGWPRCAGCQEPVRSSARRQAPRLGQPDCGVALSLSLASRPRSASPIVRPRCWPWSPRANQPADRPGAVHHPQDRQHPHLKDPRQAGELPVAGRQPRSLIASASTSDEPRRPLPLFLGMAADAADQSAASSVPSPWQRRPGIPRFWLLAWPRRRQYAK